MQFLLLLSALLTGLTGLIAGERPLEARQVERSAFTAAVESASAVSVATSEAVVALPAAVGFAVARAAEPEPAAQAPRRFVRVDERRLE